MSMSETVYTWEASELGWPPGVYPPYFRIGHIVFKFVSLVKDADGDILYWNYMASSDVWAKVLND